MSEGLANLKLGTSKNAKDAIVVWCMYWYFCNKQHVRHMHCNQLSEPQIATSQRTLGQRLDMTRASAAGTTTNTTAACCTASASNSDTAPAPASMNHTHHHQVPVHHGPVSPNPTQRKQHHQQQQLDQMERSTSVTCSASDWDCAPAEADAPPPRGDRDRRSRRKRRGRGGKKHGQRPSAASVMNGSSISVATRSGSVSSLSTAADDDIDDFDGAFDDDDSDSWMKGGRRGCRRMDRVAEGFRSGVRVKDRIYHLVTYKKCFVGSEAVDLLVRRGYASTRAEAVRLGRDVAAEYDLFEHVCRNHEFKDDFLFYRFKETSVPITVRLGGGDNVGDGDGHEHGPALSLTDKELASAVAALNRVEVRDRRHHLATHAACFVGSEAVDVLVSSGVAKSRSNAVLIGRAVATRRRGLFNHVVDPSHPLEDGYHFYRFRERAALPEEEDDDDDDSDCDTAVSSISSTSARMRAEAARTRRRAMVWPAGGLSASARNHTQHQQQHHPQQPPPTSLERASLLSLTWQSLRSTSIGSGTSGTAGGGDSSAMTVVADLNGYVRALRRVEVKDRIVVTGEDGRGTVQRRCFLGSDAVNAMVYAGYAGSRSEGAAICRRLMEECSLFANAVAAHDGTTGSDDIFQDGAERLYRFTKSMPGKSVRSKSKSRRRAAREKKVLDFLATVLRKVEVKDRKWRLLLKTYPRVFVGREAVDLLVEGKYAKSRSDAVRIGRRLATECNLFERVVGGNDSSTGAIFDDDCCFYRFKEIT